MKKKIITAILAACMLAGATAPTAFAAEREEKLGYIGKMPVTL